MDKYKGIPAHYIPAAGTKLRLTLEALMDGNIKTTEELAHLLKGDPRSPLQDLTRKKNWLIHNLSGLGRKGRYKLDSRHLAKNTRLDSEARVEAELTYKNQSLDICKRETARLPQAEIDLMLAEKKAESNQDELDL